jgi:hypothetical protein
LFNPVIDGLQHDAKRRGLKFTLGKRYPIYEERAAGSAQAGMMYFTLDDEGKKQAMSDKFFQTEAASLIGDESQDFNNPNASRGSEPQLKWDGVISGNVPSVR